MLDRHDYRADMDMTVIGIVLFVALIGGLFLLTIKLGRYGRGREREVEDVTRETALRDVSTPWQGGTGYLPTEGMGHSPRERIRSTDDER